MLAVAHPTENDWKPLQTSTISRSVHSTSATTSAMTSRDQPAAINPSSTPMSGSTSSSNTVVPQPVSTNGTSSNPKPLVRSKSRGASVGGFVNGLVNGVHAGMNGLRSVGNKSATPNGYHSEYIPSKAGLFKAKSPPRSSAVGNMEGSPSPTRLRDQHSFARAIPKPHNRSQSKPRAYDSEGEASPSIPARPARPFYPPIAAQYASNQSPISPVPTLNGHTSHIPISPTTQSPSSPAFPPKPTPSAPATLPQLPSHIITGPVPQSAARAVLELDAIPPTELLKVLAALLEQIAVANDVLQTERKSQSEEERATTPTEEGAPSGPRDVSRPVRTSSLNALSSRTPVWDQLTSASRIALANPNATLSFHARHIPQISLEAYLMRILKYCPTANATFVAVLVYFDRMCRMAGNVDGERELLGLTIGVGESSVSKGKSKANFAIDSFNVHRLVIAGVTVASKFFSDVFYTNSRYAKVGGLPQAELNQLELQFLLLNDFALVIPPEELARYSAQLIAYAQSRGVDLKPQGLGTGKPGREAKLVLGMEVPVQIPEPDAFTWREKPPIYRDEAMSMYPPAVYAGDPLHGMNSRGFVPGMSRAVPNQFGTPQPAQPLHQTGHLFNRHATEGNDIAPDSETEVSTDEDSTIRARSGSESETSEWGQGTDDGAETETEGEDDNGDDSFDFVRRPRDLPVSNSSIGSGEMHRR